MRRRKKMIVDLKARLFFRPSIGPTKIGQQVKAVAFLKKFAYFNNRFARHCNGNFAVAFGNARNPRVVLLFQLFHKDVEFFSHITFEPQVSVART